MDYSKTHYYKYSGSTAPNRTKSTIPEFEQDNVNPMFGNGLQGTSENYTQNGVQTNVMNEGSSEEYIQNNIPNSMHMNSTQNGMQNSIPDNMQDSTQINGTQDDMENDVPDSVQNGMHINGTQDNTQNSRRRPNHTPDTSEPSVPVVPIVLPDSIPVETAPSTGTQVVPPENGVTIPLSPITGTNGTLWSWVFLSPLFSSISAVAQARFYNAAAIMEPIDIYLNNQSVVSDLGYSEYTDYLYIIPGYYTLTVYRHANPRVPVWNGRVNFVRNSTCMVNFIGTTRNFSLQFIC